MAKDLMTDADVELEIERLKESEAVKLAQRERQYKYRRRQYLYTLRWYESAARNCRRRALQSTISPLMIRNKQ